MARDGRFASTAEELHRFVDTVLEGGEAHFTFEASRSSLWVYDQVRAHVDEDHVHVAQAKRIRAIANSNAKNDSNDAWWLAYLTYEGRLPEAYVPRAEILELRIATRERTCAVRHRTKIINRLKSHFAQLGEIVPSSSVKTERARLFMAKRALESVESWRRPARQHVRGLPVIHPRTTSETTRKRAASPTRGPPTDSPEDPSFSGFLSC